MAVLSLGYATVTIRNPECITTTRVYFSLRLHLSCGLTTAPWFCSIHLPHPEDQVQYFLTFPKFVYSMYICAPYVKRVRFFCTPKVNFTPLQGAITPAESEWSKRKKEPPSCAQGKHRWVNPGMAFRGSDWTWLCHVCSHAAGQIRSQGHLWWQWGEEVFSPH